MKNPMWLRMTGEVMSIYFYVHVYLDYVLFHDCRDHVIFSVKRGYI